MCSKPEIWADTSSLSKLDRQRPGECPSTCTNARFFLGKVDGQLDGQGVCRLGGQTLATLEGLQCPPSPSGESLGARASGAPRRPEPSATTSPITRPEPTSCDDEALTKTLDASLSTTACSRITRRAIRTPHRDSLAHRALVLFVAAVLALSLGLGLGLGLGRSVSRAPTPTPVDAGAADAGEGGAP